jgi:alkyl hydroperoxide reductase subunit F
MIDGALFQNEVHARQHHGRAGGVPERPAVRPGPHDARGNLAKLDTGAAARKAADLAQQGAFDVLVGGGGPAGSSAAIYAARKGIRTGVAAERFGGQVLDTLGIENFHLRAGDRGPEAGRGAGSST